MTHRGIVRVTHEGSRGTSVRYVLDGDTGIARYFLVGDEDGDPIYVQEDVEDTTDAAATAAMLAAR